MTIRRLMRHHIYMDPALAAFRIFRLTFIAKSLAAHDPRKIGVPNCVEVFAGDVFDQAADNLFARETQPVTVGIVHKLVTSRRVQISHRVWKLIGDLLQQHFRIARLLLGFNLVVDIE